MEHTCIYNPISVPGSVTSGVFSRSNSKIWAARLGGRLGTNLPWARPAQQLLRSEKLVKERSSARRVTR
jgi:hypothetical protein